MQSVSRAFALSIIQHAERDGLSLPAALVEAVRAAPRVPLSLQDALWEAYCRAGTPAPVGLRIGLALQVAHLDSAGLQLIACDTPGEALHLAPTGVIPVLGLHGAARRADGVRRGARQPGLRRGATGVAAGRRQCAAARAPAHVHHTHAGRPRAFESGRIGAARGASPSRLGPRARGRRAGSERAPSGAPAGHRRPVVQGRARSPARRHGVPCAAGSAPGRRHRGRSGLCRRRRLRARLSPLAGHDPGLAGAAPRSQWKASWRMAAATCCEWMCQRPSRCS